jgi:hypothetical protein
MQYKQIALVVRRRLRVLLTYATKANDDSKMQRPSEWLFCADSAVEPQA